jgi:hypothetical protein
MIDQRFPRAKALGELAPGRSRAGDPQHRFQAPAPLLGRAATPGLCRLEQGTELLPERIGEGRQTRQRDRKRQHVCTRNRRSLAGPALGVAARRSGLMTAAEMRPPDQELALLFGHCKPLHEPAHFCQAQVETGGLTRAFFSCVRWRTTESTACAKRARVMNRYQARYVRTSY